MRTLPPRPDLDQLKRQARELLDAVTEGNADAIAEVEKHFGLPKERPLALHDALLVIARAHGFDSWPRLKAFVNGVTIRRLIDAIRAGDMPTVERMLASKPELARMHVAESDEHQALHHAVLARRPEMVRLLMRHGADPHSGIWPHRDATTPLTLARDRGDDEIVSIIREEQLRRGPTRDIDDDVLRREVFDAFRRGDEDALIAFLDANRALINGADPRGGTTLMVASAYLLERVVAWLLEHGADPRARTPTGGTALGAVGGGVNTDTPDWSLRSDRIGELLLRHGAEMTPGWAVRTGNLEKLRELHDNFAAARAQEPSMGHVMSMAVSARRPDVVTFLLDLGYDPDEKHRLGHLEEVVDTWGGPLRAAVLAGDTAIARLLLERGATPRTNVYASSTAIYEAYARKDSEMVQLLERYGGVPTPGDMAYLGLTDRAKRALDEEARQSDGGRAASAQAVLQGGADTGNVDLVRAALAYIDWDSGDARWHWMLMRPLGRHSSTDRARYENILRAILERAGADVRGPFGRTLLHDVSGAWPRGAPMEADDRLGFAKTLLEFGARLNVRDETLRSTPLGWACRWGRPELVRLLLERGADPVEADAEPWATPIAWARKSDNREILAMLRA
jgi:ankyrin repeat protein